MKNIKLIIQFLIFIPLIITACNEKQDTVPLQILTISGKITNNSDCKSNKSSLINNSESCINYKLNKESNTLLIDHINAGFNCCPDSIYCVISENNDTIIIEEFENETACRCNCLYDLNIEIEGIDSKKYIIKIIEPYAIDEAELVFSIDLTNNENGNYCVTRTKYPWGL